ncbi:uncharacterized protein Z519_03394 [Cladophialophora bantiana CBS 173.52]|uniref:Uncharacterized protein n=1 Tax=Cladophialophora bantiana (strain ATCC 10958 / CBS 173.52 / CDC B-1940 / NIH 8579) TaxID=1442370 RepID=A0A0D2HZH3_CLAB1|nr:uncharacterized protein Z519_03394 [Cladophialophora bantiana CBS 173.52]KIW96325.1 hypothetical protein Z519_03394 [Cladophialophora bantiana CBS 173.52]
MATTAVYVSGKRTQQHDHRSLVAADVTVSSIENDRSENIRFPRVKQEEADPGRPPRIKQELEDDDEGDNWLDADEDVLHARLRKRGLKLEDIPLF